MNRRARSRILLPFSPLRFPVRRFSSIGKAPLVQYLGMEDILFAIQVGSSSVKDGIVMQDFQSPFYICRNKE